MLGGFLALLSAACFSMNNAAARRGVLSGSVLQAMVISVPFGVPFFFIALLIFGSLSDLQSFSFRGVSWLAAAGILHFVVGRYANYRGAKAIGANLVGPIQDSNILVSLGFAIFLLGEKLTAIMVLGILLVCIGPVLTWKKGEAKAEVKKPPTFKPLWGEGIFFAVVSALAYGTSPILVRLGLDGGGVGRGTAAGLISYLAASGCVFLMLLRPGALSEVRATGRGNLNWFLFASLAVGMAQLLRYMALSMAPVSVVAPMMRLSSVFRVYLSWLVNREHEVFGPGVLLGTIVSVLGALILSLQVDVVRAVLPAWDGVAALLVWRWP
jgi:drug/metabolite transporter (DMT)-like permease